MDTMTARDLLGEGMRILADRPDMATVSNVANLRIAARLTWEREEMGGADHVAFAHRNGTPIVPPGHCCHPDELVKRGFVDGSGWPARKPAIRLFRWPDGRHWYASVDGRDVSENGIVKWNTEQDAEDAAVRFRAKNTPP